ncbi:MULTISPECIES: hypothetical protein [unclassified Burkholderia]|uniref:hypothetical protein n=1 Tax=unclassified Burkholderia TaxID=2613784 RepID=UPI00141D898D|nr:MULTISPECIES: hypothetical protein [unclassified Burkholderia]NIE87214.1 hypothetical protein [Burkholderia sp. Tr-860]NIF65761.1 hypothetical protein [Burkholderia sp. Cy-647]NIF99507.1 hypothetical protein [Burkholderia sp. Ax-1720]
MRDDARSCAPPRIRHSRLRLDGGFPSFTNLLSDACHAGRDDIATPGARRYITHHASRDDASRNRPEDAISRQAGRLAPLHPNQTVDR